MTRRRFVQINGELHEVTADFVAPERRISGDAALWNDRIYQDCNDPRFRSRTQHRDYMRRYGLATVDDYGEQWRKSERDRINARRGIDPSRRPAIERAIAALNNRRKNG